MSTEQAQWHAPDAELAHYLAGGSGAVSAASIEAHLLGCGRCRDRLAGLTTGGTTGEPAELTAGWDRLADSIDRPSRGRLDRLLGGHRLATAAVITPGMLQSAVTALALLGAVPLLAALVSPAAPVAALVAAAPLAPVAAVALAYRASSDPAGEIGLATPTAGLPLVALRALVVSLVELPLMLAALGAVDAWVEDVPTRAALAWCLPGLALAALVLLAGTTRLDPWRVAVGLGAGWALAVLAVVTGSRSLRVQALLDVVTSPALQLAALLVAAAALLLTVVRRDAVAYRRTA